MKQEAFIPSTIGLRTSASLAGLAMAILMAASASAFGQADTQPTRDRAQPAGSSSMGQQTFEGQIVPLYNHLAKSSPMASTTPTPGQNREASPGTAPSDARRDATSAMGAGGLAQPLALITHSSSGAAWGTARPSADANQRSGTERSATERSETERSEPLGRTPTDRPGTTPSRTPGDQPDPASARTSQTPGARGQGGVYILVFNPDDPQSRSAYQMAQTIAQSSHQTDRMPVREPEAATRATSASATGEQIKVTGRVMQHGQLQAIAVQKVERTTGAQPKRSTESETDSTPRR